jgi:hypothetical protein
VPLVRLIGSVHPVAIECSGSEAGHVAVPDLIGVFREIEAGGFPPCRIVKADLYPGRMSGKYGKIHALAIP